MPSSTTTKTKYPVVPDRPEVLNPGDVWVDYEARQIVLHVSAATEMRFSMSEADKFFTRFQGARLCLHDHIRLKGDLMARNEEAHDPFSKPYSKSRK